MDIGRKCYGRLDRRRVELHCRVVEGVPDPHWYQSALA